MDFNRGQSACISLSKVPSAVARTARLSSPPSQEPSGSLIDWHEPARNARVLDWRARAHEFGLVPVEAEGAGDGLVVEPADRLLEEEEAEAFGEQNLDNIPHEARGAEE